MQTTLNISPYESNHLEEILSYQHDLYTLNFPTTKFDDEFYSWIEEMYESDKNTSFVALFEEQVVGFYCFNEEGYLMQVYIQNDFRGQGLGKKIMEHYEKQISLLRKPMCLLHSSMFNERAIRFYLSLGYRLVLTEEDRHSHLLMKFL